MSRVGRALSRVGLITGSRIAGAAIGLVTQIVLARTLSTAWLGEFFFATSLASILAIVAAGGFPSVTARFLIRYRDHRASHLAGLFMRTSRRFAIAGAFVVSALAIGAALVWPDLSDEARMSVVLGCLAILPAAMSRVAGAAATAYRRFNLSFLPDLLARPLLFLGVILLIQAITGETSLVTVLVVFVVLYGLQAAYQTMSVRRTIPAAGPVPAGAGRAVRLWRKVALPYVSIALFTAIFGDLAILVAGFFLDRADLAMFGVVVKLTLIVGFAVNTAYQVALPDLGDALKARDRASLSRAIGLANIMGMGIALAAILGAIVAGGPVLGLFGEEFAGGRDQLIVLLVGQAIIAAGGPSTQLLTLTGNRTGLMLASLGGVVALTALNAALIPVLGLWGAVLAVLAVNALWSATLVLIARSALGHGADVIAVVAAILARRKKSRDPVIA